MSRQDLQRVEVLTEALAGQVSRWWRRSADSQGSWPHLEQPAYCWHPRVCDRTGSVALCRFRPEPGGGGSVREGWSQSLARDAAQVDGRRWVVAVAQAATKLSSAALAA